jgi:hypothetical protein
LQTWLAFFARLIYWGIRLFEAAIGSVCDNLGPGFIGLTQSDRIRVTLATIPA